MEQKTFCTTEDRRWPHGDTYVLLYTTICLLVWREIGANPVLQDFCIRHYYEARPVLNLNLLACPKTVHTLIGNLSAESLEQGVPGPR